MRTSIPEESQEKTFTWQELARHNRPDDAYVAIRGNVYNITDFIKLHPGGRNILQLAAGKDVTQSFETYHELGKVDIILKKYYIGTLTSNELPTFPEVSEFYKTLKKRVGEYFENNGIDPKNRVDIWVRYAFIYGTFLYSYYAQFFDPVVTERFWLQIMFAILLGYMAAQIGLNPLHDASHFSVTHNPWIWSLLGSTHDFLNGASHLAWQYQHQFGHHIYTNISGADPDVRTGEPVDIRRIKHNQRWYSHYFNQQIFVPIVYGFLALKTRLQDVQTLYIAKASDNIKVNPISAYHTAVFCGGKAFFILYRIILPMVFFPVSKVVTLLVISDFVASYWLAFTFQANHVVDEVEWPLPDENGFINQDWAEMQVVTTQDYAHGAIFLTSMVGALNYQAVHHLFPNISQHYYHDIAPIIKETCKEFGIKYYYKDTLWEAVGSHIEHLRIMGLPPTEEKKKL